MTRDLLTIAVQSLLGVGGWEGSSPLEWRRAEGKSKRDTGEHSQACSTQREQGSDAAERGAQYLWGEPPTTASMQTCRGDGARGLGTRTCRANRRPGRAGAWSTVPVSRGPWQRDYGRQTRRSLHANRDRGASVGSRPWVCGIMLRERWKSDSLEPSPGQTELRLRSGWVAAARYPDVFPRTCWPTTQQPEAAGEPRAPAASLQGPLLRKLNITLTAKSGLEEFHSVHLPSMC